MKKASELHEKESMNSSIYKLLGERDNLTYMEKKFQQQISVLNKRLKDATAENATIKSEYEAINLQFLKVTEERDCLYKAKNDEKWSSTIVFMWARYILCFLGSESILDINGLGERKLFDKKPNGSIVWAWFISNPLKNACVASVSLNPPKDIFRSHKIGWNWLDMLLYK